MSKLVEALKRAEELRKQRMAEATPVSDSPEARIRSSQSDVDAIVKERESLEEVLSQREREINDDRAALARVTEEKRAAEQAALDAAREREAAVASEADALKASLALEEAATTAAKQREEAERIAARAAADAAEAERIKQLAREKRINADRRATEAALKRADEDRHRKMVNAREAVREHRDAEATLKAATDHEEALANPLLQPDTVAHSEIAPQRGGGRWLTILFVAAAMFAAGVYLAPSVPLLSQKETLKASVVSSPTTNVAAPDAVVASAVPVITLAAAADESPLVLRMSITLTTKPLTTKQ